MLTTIRASAEQNTINNNNYYNTMPVDTSLTDSMLKRLTKIDSKFREDGDENDPTRLCNAWGGALNEDKLELEKLVTDMESEGGTMGASKIKEEYPKYRIYSTRALQNALGNYRTKAREAIKKRAESKCVWCCYCQLI